MSNKSYQNGANSTANGKSGPPAGASEHDKKQWAAGRSDQEKKDANKKN